MNKKENPMILKHFYLTETNCKDLERLSEQTGKSQAEIVRQAIQAYVNKHQRI